MPFTGSGWTINFRPDLLQGRHNFNPDGDTFKIALYTNQARLDLLNTVAYTVDGEVSDSTYTPGGMEAVSQGIFQPGVNSNGPDIPQMAYVTFAPVVWPLANFTARGALLYNATKGNAAIAIADFGYDIANAAQDFELKFDQGDPAQAPVQVR